MNEKPQKLSGISAEKPKKTPFTSGATNIPFPTDCSISIQRNELEIPEGCSVEETDFPTVTCERVHTVREYRGSIRWYTDEA